MLDRGLSHQKIPRHQSHTSLFVRNSCPYSVYDIFQSSYQDAAASQQVALHSLLRDLTQQMANDSIPYHKNQ